MINGYSIVTLCGSTKFEKEFKETQRKLTIDGYIVISCGLFGHGSDKEYFESLSLDQQNDLKKSLDKIHKSKIDLSDAIVVINPNGYIGESTKNEIEYAKKHNKKIMYLEEPKEKN